jgi:hypothetical protein
MDYSYDSGYGSRGILDMLPDLFSLFSIAFYVLIGVLVWRWWQKRRRNGGGEPLMPSGDPMRYALASAVLKGPLFRKRILDMVRNPFRASAPESGLEMPTLIAAVRRIENEDRQWQWLFVVLLVAAWLLPGLLVDLLDDFNIGGLAFMAIVIAILGLALYRQWYARFRQVVPFRAEHYSLQAVRDRFGQAEGVEAGFDPARSNVIVYGRTSPLVGFGVTINTWQVGIDVTRAESPFAPVAPVQLDEVVLKVCEAVAALRLPGMSLAEVAFINGTETGRTPEVQTDRFSAPAHAISGRQIVQWRQQTDAPARVYSWIRVPGSGGEVSFHYFFRVVMRGEALCVESVQTFIPPVAKAYREVDSIRRLSFFGMIGWGATALAMVPLTLIGAIAGAGQQIGEWVWGFFGGPVGKERKEINLNPMYNYGAMETVREAIADNKFHIYFQRADGSQVVQALDLQVLNAVTDLLKGRGIDVSALKEQAIVVQQNSVSIQSGGGSVNIGAGAAVGSAVSQAAKAVGVRRA